MREEYDFSKGTRGAIVPTPAGKTRITIRLDSDIVEWFRNQVESRGGGNYQTMINDALGDYITSDRETLEQTIRRVLEEISAKALHLSAMPIHKYETAANKGLSDLLLGNLNTFARTSERPENNYH